MKKQMNPLFRNVKPRYRIHFGFHSDSLIRRFCYVPHKDQDRCANFICPVTGESILILPIEYCLQK